MSGQYEIEALSRTCMKSFGGLFRSLTDCPDEIQIDLPVKKIENEFAQFKIWCGNLGALQRGANSLDVRLRDSGVLRGAVISFLTKLEEAIKQCIEITTGNRVPWNMMHLASDNDTDNKQEVENRVYGDEESDDQGSETSDDSESGSELAERFLDMQDAIAGLHRLAFRMRNANYRSISTKALATKSVDPETGVDMFSAFAEFDYRHVVESFQQLRRSHKPLGSNLQSIRDTADIFPTFLLKRLSKAITNRRRNFAYWHEHSLKLLHSGIEPSPTQVESDKPKALLLNDSSHRGSDITHTQGGSALLHAEIRQSDTAFDEEFDTESDISYATTARDNDGNPSDLPLPPADASLKTEFICPYCRVLCPSRQGQGKAWRMHILQDLQPYVCTFADCPNGDCMYATQLSWIEHERLCHRRVWRCFDKAHRAFQCQSEKELYLHYSESHPELTELQVRQFVELTEIAVPDQRTICQFCNEGPFELQGLHSHMAFHQEKLALFAIPRSLEGYKDGEGKRDEEQEDDIRSDKALGKRSTASLSSVSLHLSDTATYVGSSNVSFADSRDTAFDDGAEYLVKTSLDDKANIDLQDGAFDEALCVASSEGNEMLVERLLNKGANVNAQVGRYDNAIQAASLGGYMEVVKILLDYGADLNPQVGLYGNPLQAASYRGHVEIVRLLLDSGADVNARAGRFHSALIAAVVGGSKETVTRLLDIGADVNMRGKDSCTALTMAACQNNKEVAELLLTRGAEIDAQSDRYGTAFCAALFHENDDIVVLLYVQGADVHAEGGQFGNALGVAAYKGNESMVKLLLRQEADMNAQGTVFCGALQAAAAGGKRKILDTLLAEGADINRPGGRYGSALGAAANYGKHWIVAQLLINDANISAFNEHGETSLHLASASGHIRVLELLMTHGAHLNAQYNNGLTSLMYALGKGHSQAAELLLKWGAQCSVAGKAGNIALALASEQGHVDIVQRMLDKMAGWNSANDDGLILASLNGNLEVVRLLLDKGADCATAGKNGWTAINSASVNSHLEVVKLLLDRGGDMSANDQGWTPLISAASQGHTNVVKLLLDHGADLNHSTLKGSTPLQISTSNGHLAVVKLLMERAARMPAGPSKIPPFAIAAAEGDVQVAKLLLKKGADPSLVCSDSFVLLHAAAKNHPQTDQLLLAKGANSSAVIGRGSESETKSDQEAKRPPNIRRPRTIIFSEQRSSWIPDGGQDPWPKRLTSRPPLVPPIRTPSMYHAPRARVLVESSRPSRREFVRDSQKPPQERRTRQVYNDIDREPSRRRQYSRANDNVPITHDYASRHRETEEARTDKTEFDAQERL